MNKLQRDLQRAAWSRNLDATYEAVQGYAYGFKKYNYMTMRQVDEVVFELAKLYRKEGRKAK